MAPYGYLCVLISTYAFILNATPTEGRILADFQLHRVEASSSTTDVPLNEGKINPISPTKCCGRQEKNQFIGYGLDGKSLYVDVGRCFKKVEAKKIHRKEFEEMLKINKEIDPIELFLHLQLNASSKSCGNESFLCDCLPVQITLERYLTTMKGLEQVAVTKDCVCVPKNKPCHRVSQNVIHFPGTPFEKVVDVGSCTGSCTSTSLDDGLSYETSCKSIQNTTVAINGPNGYLSIDVIDKCSCTSSCYRAISFEHVYDYSSDDDDDRLIDQPVIKIVDVGKCINVGGECGSLHQEQHCVVKDTGNTKCILSLTRQMSTCAPTDFKLHPYKNQLGEKKNLHSVTSCSCR